MGGFFTNPLIVKELRERFRVKKSIWILALYLLILGAILLGFVYLEQMNSLSAPGENREAFIVMAVIQYGMICFIAPALSAGTVSGERERQTLNILLTTQLSPLKIVLSKLLTSLAFIFLLVVASIPLYSLMFLYGGISPSQLLTLVVFFAVNIILFGSLGLFCSTWVKRTGVSTILAYGLAFFFVVGTGLLVMFLGPLIAEMSDSVQPVDPMDYVGMQVLSSLNPVIIMSNILGEDFGPKLRLFMEPWQFFVIVCCLLSALLVAWSGYLLRPIRRSWFGWRKS
ncbi:ABC transporter permease [Brevibacillus humidisoli]|uniref:ABC transporter permease n=1 Tax=Brevibacillus humidisoli TaxID=2895522 RepID=UPI001E283930|nr:ABC transporter permease subunit [Brevibacillus humidisoli]UFJ42287.1 ABC transporter permease [Brevibacillus humidisoli]